MYYYYTSVFLVLSEKQKVEYKKKLIHNFFSQLNYYVLPSVNPTTVLWTIKLFKNELNISFLKSFLLKSITYLNLYYHNKKGHYKIIRLMDKNLKI